MSYQELVNRAKSMECNFLFYNPEYQEDFFNNLDKNIVVEGDNHIFFIDRSENQNMLFWAGNTMEDVVNNLDSLKDVLGEGQTLTIRCGEDKSSPGLIQRVLPAFIDKGLHKEHHNVAYKTLDLEFQWDSSLAVEAGRQDLTKAFSLICDVLGKEELDIDSNEALSYIDNEDKAMFIVRDDDKICGVILAHIYANGTMVFIRGLAVDAEYRGKGYSNHLLSKVFSWAKGKGVQKSMLWVEADNKPAIALYEKFGYFPYGDQEIVLKYVL